MIASVDGPMIAYGSRGPRPKGTITMLGRIMAGSQAVIAHDEAGQALFVAYHPPAIHVSQVMVAYGQKGALATGTAIFVSDRAVNAVARACAFTTQGLGWLCRLDDNEPQGLESCAAPQVGILKEGARVSRGPWKTPRPEDPRHVVVVEPPEGKTLVDWGTPQVADALAATEWPQVDRARNAMQDQSFKRMMDHGALHTNDGRKQIVGADRHQQRARAKLDQALASAHKRVDKKAEAVQATQDQVAESKSKGHDQRLDQRQRALAVLEKECQAAQDHQDQRAAQAAALAPPRERADRDFRKQTILTLRTLLLENALRAFMIVLLGTLQTQGSLACVLRLLFERSGARMEPNSQVVYGVNTAGVSVPYRHILTAIVEGLCAMDMREQGKPLCVRLKDMPP